MALFTALLNAFNASASAPLLEFWMSQIAMCMHVVDTAAKITFPVTPLARPETKFV